VEIVVALHIAVPYPGFLDAFGVTAAVPYQPLALVAEPTP
jgi:hypothetical protein